MHDCILPTKRQRKSDKEWSNLYKIESKGTESFSEFRKRVKQLKKEGLF